ncbi:ribosomal protein S5 domain 2-type protein, partial [Syncephalis pseudoplumigaleata]
HAEQQRVIDTLMQQYIPGEVVLFSWTAWLTEFMEEQRSDHAREVQPQHSMTATWPADQIVHGPPMVDRKSTFVAHLAAIHSAEDRDRVVSTLLMDRKIARATHNISAYRVPRDVLVAIAASIMLILRAYAIDCDDDGETAAGGRLLHLLQIVDAQNVVVVVSRWYGGIQLGPDRFKHINNVARQLLDAHGYIKDAGGKPSASKRSKNNK